MLGIIPGYKQKFSAAKFVEGAAQAPQYLIHLGASPALLFWIFLVHAAMAVIFVYFFFVLNLPLLILLLFLLFLLCVFAANYGCYKRSCGCSLAFGAQGWFFYDVLGRRSHAELDCALIWPGLVVLYLYGPSRQSRTVIITSDRASADEVRRLRVFLRMSL